MVVETKVIDYLDKSKYRIKDAYKPSSRLNEFERDAYLECYTENPDAWLKVASLDENVGRYGIDDYNRIVEIKMDHFNPDCGFNYTKASDTKEGIILNIDCQTHIYECFLFAANYQPPHLKMEGFRRYIIRTNLNKFIYGHNANNMIGAKKIAECNDLFDQAILEQFGIDLSRAHVISMDVNLNMLFDSGFNMVKHLYHLNSYSRSGVSSSNTKDGNEHSIAFKFDCKTKAKVYNKGKELLKKQSYYLNLPVGMQLIRNEMTVKLKDLGINKPIGIFIDLDYNNIYRHAIGLIVKSYDHNLKRCIEEVVRLKPGFKHSDPTCFEVIEEWFMLEYKVDAKKGKRNFSNHKTSFLKSNPDRHKELSAIEEYGKRLKQLKRSYRVN